MTKYTILKRKLLKKLTILRNNTPDSPKKHAIIELIQNFKSLIHKINKRDRTNVVKLYIITIQLKTQLMIIQSQPIPKFQKGGILAENANIKYGVVSDKEIVINKTI